MKNIIYIILLIGFAMASSQVINTQGVLRDANNKAVPNGTYSIEFSIYPDISTGSSIWSETYDVPVVNGVYSVSLGVNESLFNSTGPFWLELNVNGDGPMERLQIHLSPYDQLIVTNQNNVFPTDGNVGIGVTVPSTKLEIHGDGGMLAHHSTSQSWFSQILIKSLTSPSGHTNKGTLKIGYDPTTGDWGHGYIQAVVPWIYNAPIAINPSGGLVGIGTYNPSYQLHINGNMATTMLYDLDNADWYLDPAYISRLNVVRTSYMQDNDDVNYYVDPTANTILNFIKANSTDFQNTIDAWDIGENAVGKNELSPAAGRAQSFDYVCATWNQCPTGTVGTSEGNTYVDCGAEGGFVVATMNTNVQAWGFAYLLLGAQNQGYPEDSYVTVAQEIVSGGYNASYNSASATCPCIPNTKVRVTFHEEDDADITSAYIVKWSY